MVELVDTRDLKSLGHKPCGFEPRQRHQKIGKSQERDLPIFSYRGTK